MLHGVAEAEHIFRELYRVPEKIRIPYFKVKILELLLYLDTMTIPDTVGERPYFYRTQVEKVKAIRRFLAKHLSEHYTQEALRHPHDGDEDLLPVGLWHIHRQLTGRLSDERGGGIAAPGAGAEHCGDRRPGRI